MDKVYFDEQRAYPDGIPDFETLRTNIVIPAEGKTFVFTAKTKEGLAIELMLSEIKPAEDKPKQYQASLYKGHDEVGHNDVFDRKAWEYIEDVYLSKDEDEQLRVLGPVAVDPDSAEKKRGIKSKKLWLALGGAAAVGLSGIAVYYLKKRHPKD